jgi:hypothetical protein
MSLKLLNPGLRPLGQFDLDDTDAGALEGGEYVELAAMASPGAEGYAADVAAGPSPGGVAGIGAPTGIFFQRSTRTAGRLGGLADEGDAEYGTLFGSLIGSNVGQATTQSGAVVIGPTSDRGSGKVTVWATPGLFGVNDNADTLGTATSIVNAAVVGTAATGLLATTGGGGQTVALYVGRVTDSSLVSTTQTAVGLTSATEYHAVWYLGEMD